MGNLQRTTLFLTALSIRKYKAKSFTVGAGFLTVPSHSGRQENERQTQNRKRVFQARHFYQELTAEN